MALPSVLPSVPQAGSEVAVPQAGIDVPWFGPPHLKPPEQWLATMNDDKDWLFSNGLVPFPAEADQPLYCGYCEILVKSAEDHLGGYYKDSKSHYKWAAQIGDAQDALRIGGWSLADEGITVKDHMFTCTPCNTLGPWHQLFAHGATRAHRQNAGDVVSLADDNMKAVWFNMFPMEVQRATITSAAKGSKSRVAKSKGRCPKGMEEPRPSIAECLEAKDIAVRRGFPFAPPPLCWARNFAKRGMGLWCDSCQNWVGWGKFGQEMSMDPDGECEHYTTEVRNTMIGDWHSGKEWPFTDA